MDYAALIAELQSATPPTAVSRSIPVWNAPQVCMRRNSGSLQNEEQLLAETKAKLQHICSPTAHLPEIDQFHALMKQCRALLALGAVLPASSSVWREAAALELHALTLKEKTRLSFRGKLLREPVAEEVIDYLALQASATRREHT